jgi:hypothetical protein
MNAQFQGAFFLLFFNDDITNILVDLEVVFQVYATTTTTTTIECI